jgi:hypothetical protein
MLSFGVTNTDPNRPGMHMKLIKFLLNLRAPRIVYVSCNPATCARDLDYLCHGVVCVILILLCFSSIFEIQLSELLKVLCRQS